MSGPILPINIKNIIINSPSGDNDDVKPRESPTVPSADTASKATSKKGASSTTSNVKIANQVTPAEIMVKANALYTDSLHP